MATTDRLAEIQALISERNSEFKPITSLGEELRPGVTHWPLSKLKLHFGYEENETIAPALNRAKISAETAGWVLADHFIDGNLYDAPGEVFVSKYAALMVLQNADVSKQQVAHAQSYFALQVDKQALEDEKRIRSRFEVQSENKKLAGAAKDAGVQDMKKFNGVGISALYGGLAVAQIKRMKGIKEAGTFLDHVSSEELAANLFRITQTAAALRRQTTEDEQRACATHRRVATDVRETIRRAGNTLPENLPRAEVKIDRLLTAKKRELTGGKRKSTKI